MSEHMELAMAHVMELEPDQLRSLIAHAAGLHAHAQGAWQTSDCLRRVARALDAQSHCERMASILDDVAARYGVAPKDILGPSRCHELVYARHEAMYLMRETRAPSGFRRFTLPQIGRFMRRDHSTVVSGISAHGRRLRDEAA